MKLSSLFAALCAGSAVASELSLTSRGPKCPQTEGNKDDQIIAHFKQTGNCFSYINGGSREKSFAPCSGPDGYCQKVKKSKSGVEGVGEPLPYTRSRVTNQRILPKSLVQVIHS